MNDNRLIEPGDIVQIEPGRDWAYALVVVMEVRDWGVIGYVSHLRSRSETDQIPLRLKTGDYSWTGGKVVYWTEGETT